MRRTRLTATLRSTSGAAAAHILLLVLLGVVLAARPAHAKLYVYTTRQEIPLSTQRTLVVENASGEITILPAEANRVSLEAKKRVHARNVDDANDLVREVPIRVGSNRDSVRIKVEYPKFSFHLFRLTHYSPDVALQILAPPTMRVEVSTASADVVIRDMRGPATVRGASSDVELSGLGGSVYCGVASGDVVAHDVLGPVEVHTASGDVRVTTVRKRTTVRTASGDVQGDRLAGGAQINTVSGTVRLGEVGPVVIGTTSGDVSLHQAAGGASVHTVSGTLRLGVTPRTDDAIEVHSTSGDVQLTIPRALDADVSLSTTSGDMLTRLPITVRTALRRSFEGRMGRGGVPIHISTVSGDIRILPFGVQGSAKDAESGAVTISL